MFKKTLVSLAVIGAMGVTTAAFAQTGVYVDGGLGYTLQRKLNISTASNKDRKKIGGRASVGYNYDFNQEFGLGGEFGWGYYGKTTYDNGISMKSTAFDLSVVPVWHINPQFDLFARVGVARAKLATENTGTESATETKPLAGLGVGYNLTQAFQVNLTYQHIFGSNMDNGVEKDKVPSIDSVFAGVRYTF